MIANTCRGISSGISEATVSNAYLVDFLYHFTGKLSDEMKDLPLTMMKNHAELAGLEIPEHVLSDPVLLEQLIKNLHNNIHLNIYSRGKSCT